MSPSSHTLPTMLSIHDAVESKVASARESVAQLKNNHGDTTLTKITVNQAYEGIPVPCFTYETSNIDCDSIIHLRGHTLETCHSILPSPPKAEYPYVEAMFWLLLTGDVPSMEQTLAFRDELRSRAEVPATVLQVLDTLPLSTPPMTQLSTAMLAMQPDSSLKSAYHSAVPKKELWKFCLEDVLVLCARVPRIAAYIYRRSFHCDHSARLAVQGQDAEDEDMAAALARRMGFNDPVVADLFRLFISSHMDVGGGAMSCFSVHIVGSTLSDPFLAWCAGLNALAGPLHGNANQEVMAWLRELDSHLDGHDPTDDLLREFCWKTLRSGKVIPGYGHPAFRTADTRFFMQQSFAKKHLKGDRMCALVSKLYDIVPDILRKHGKVRNPHPNVDAHSGALLHAIGLCEETFYPVMFGVSRAMGPLSNLVWDRILCLPITKPYSVTTAELKAMFDI